MFTSGQMLNFVPGKVIFYGRDYCDNRNEVHRIKKMHYSSLKQLQTSPKSEILILMQDSLGDICFVSFQSKMTALVEKALKEAAYSSAQVDSWLDSSNNHFKS